MINRINSLVANDPAIAAAAAAVQLAADQAAVDAEKANIVTGTTILTKAGSYPTTATSKAAQLAADYAAVLSTTPPAPANVIMGVVAFDADDAAALVTWVESNGSLLSELAVDLAAQGLKGRLIFANLAFLEILDLSGNVLTAAPDVSTCTTLTTLTFAHNNLTTTPDVSTCTALTTLLLNYNALTTVPDVSTCTALTLLNLNNNNLSAAALETLLDDFTILGLANLTLNIGGTGNAVPNAATMAMIFDLCNTSATIVTCNAPASFVLTKSGAPAVVPEVLGTYTYDSMVGGWTGGAPASGQLYHNGTNWIIMAMVGGDTWTGDATNPEGVYTPVAGAAGSIDVAIPAP